jgi:hypothetical protein
MTTPRADEWRSRGGHFSWRPAQEDASAVEIFHVDLQEPGDDVRHVLLDRPTA